MHRETAQSHHDPYHNLMHMYDCCDTLKYLPRSPGFLARGTHSLHLYSVRAEPLSLLLPLKDGPVGAAMRFTASYKRRGRPMLT